MSEDSLLLLRISLIGPLKGRKDLIPVFQSCFILPSLLSSPAHRFLSRQINFHAVCRHSHSGLPPRRLAETIRRPITMHIIGPEDGEAGAGADEESRTRVGFVSEIRLEQQKPTLLDQQSTSSEAETSLKGTRWFARQNLQ